MKQKFAKAALLIVCLIGGATAAFQIRSTNSEVPDLQDMLSVPKTEMRMHLYGANRNDATGKSMSGKTLGFDHYRGDGKTQYHIHNDFQTGASEDIYLRPDGSKLMGKEYFPLQDPETLPTLHSFSTFATDGSTYTSHDVITQNGLLERSGKLLSSGLYQQTYYCEDGVKAHRVRLFNKDKAFQSEKLYACDTGLAYAELLPGANSWEVKINLMRADGSKSAALSKDYSGLSGDLFGEDGTTVVAHMSGEYSSQTVRYFDQNLNVTQLWSSSFGRTKVIIYGVASGLKIYSQEWKERPGQDGDPHRMLLVKVTEYAQDKANDSTREIEMSNDGKVPDLVTTTVPAGFDFKSLKYPATVTQLPDFVKLKDQTRLIFSIDPNGKVTKTELSILYQSWNNLLLPANTMPAQINFKPELLKLPAHVELPTFNDLGPDRVYDYP